MRQKRFLRAADYQCEIFCKPAIEYIPLRVPLVLSTPRYPRPREPEQDQHVATPLTRDPPGWRLSSDYKASVIS